MRTAVVNMDRVPHYEKFDTSVLRYKNIVEQLETHDLLLEQYSPSTDPERKLSLEIVTHFMSKREQRDTSVFKLQLLQKISSLVTANCQSQVLLTGSTLNGFSSRGSDLDLTICHQVWNTTDFIFFIKFLLETYCRLFIQGEVIVVQARVPILKFKTRRPGRASFWVDLSINNFNRCDRSAGEDLFFS